MNKKIISLSSFIFLISCSTPTNNTGFIKVAFKFSQKISFGIKSIPSNTEAFQISIQGEGLSTPLTKKIDKDSSDKVFFQAIPSGLKKIQVSAFDSSNKTLATAQTDVDIKAGQINTANLELKQALKNFRITLSNYPTNASYIYAQIKTNNKTVQQEVKENQLEIKDIEPGNLDLKVSAFSNDSIPLFNITKSLDTANSDSAEVGFDPISLPLTSELQANTSIPTEIINLLNKVKIEFSNNKAPKVENVELLINGRNTMPKFKSTNPTCISPDDRITINVKASDADNENINLYWGQNTLINNKYRMKLINEKSTSLSKTGSELGIGNSSIGFILTDRKSFIGPVPLYFSVRNNGCP